MSGLQPTHVAMHTAPALPSTTAQQRRAHAQAPLPTKEMPAHYRVVRVTTVLHTQSCNCTRGSQHHPVHAAAICAVTATLKVSCRSRQPLSMIAIRCGQGRELQLIQPVVPGTSTACRQHPMHSATQHCCAGHKLSSCICATGARRKHRKRRSTRRLAASTRLGGPPQFICAPVNTRFIAQSHPANQPKATTARRQRIHSTNQPAPAAILLFILFISITTHQPDALQLGVCAA